MHDKYKKAHRSTAPDERSRRQIANEAARRLIGSRDPADPQWLEALTESVLYTAKRKAAAVLGRKVRPGDLPSDSEVRTCAVELIRAGETGSNPDQQDVETSDEDEPVTKRMADHLDRFTVYKLRLIPLESIKQNPKTHPEGDVLYHSLQVFELAREARPYDEEFLLAALLHDVGKAIDPAEHVASAVESLRGAVTGRTLWLIEHHHDLDENARAKKPVEPAEFLEDLQLLVACDRRGRVAGHPVEGLDETLAYLKQLENEDYLKQ